MSEVLGQSGLLDRALRRVTSLWRDMAERVIGAEAEAIADADARLPGGSRRRGLARATAPPSWRRPIWRWTRPVAGRLPPHAGRLRLPIEAVTRSAIERVQKAADPAERASAKARLRRALEPPRLRLLTQFTTIPDGMKFLVDLRAELLQVMGGRPAAGGAGDRPARAAGELVRCRLPGTAAGSTGTARPRCWRSWWATRRCTRIRTWRDLKNRLDSDRRCYAFFHPRMPDEPLIFVEVALVKGLAGSVQQPAGREGAGARPGARRIPRSSIRSTTASGGWTASASAIS